MNDDLCQQQFALPPISELSKRLAQIPGVLGLGIGFRFVNGRRTEELAFTVDVREKLSVSRLPEEHRIPHEFAGVRLRRACEHPGAATVQRGARVATGQRLARCRRCERGTGDHSRRTPSRSDR